MGKKKSKKQKELNKAIKLVAEAFAEGIIDAIFREKHHIERPNK